MGCKSIRSTSVTKTWESQDGYSKVIAVTNPTGKSISFKFWINGKTFYPTLTSIVEDINKYEDKNTVLKVWRFTCKNSYHFPPITEKQWLHNPVLYFNSAGFGYCDDVATFSMIFWRYLGFDARLWNLGNARHIVSEVFYNGNWEMYDSDTGVFFKDSTNTFSVDALTARHSIICSETLRYVEQEKIAERSINNDYWINLSNIFSDGKSHFVETAPLFDSSLLNRNYDYLINLPPGGEIRIGDKLLPEFYTAPVEGKRWLVPQYFNLQYSIPVVDTMAIDMPLIIQNISGIGKVEISGKSFDLQDPELQEFIDQRSAFIEKIKLTNSKSVKITYLVSPLLFPWGSSNKINLRGSNVDKLRLEILGK
jgi:hypothetical protein